MFEVENAYVEITPREVEALRQRLGEAQASIQKLWHRKCECSCGCPIQHAGRETEITCVLCKGGDHWTRITEYLDEVMARRSA